MSPFHQVDVLHNGRIVCVRRSARAFEGAQELKLERSLLVEKLNSIGRAGRGLLIDSRLQNPKVHQMSLGIERQVGSREVVRVEAVHNHGNDFIIGRTAALERWNALARSTSSVRRRSSAL